MLTFATRRRQHSDGEPHKKVRRIGKQCLTFDNDACYAFGRHLHVRRPHARIRYVLHRMRWFRCEKSDGPPYPELARAEPVNGEQNRVAICRPTRKQVPAARQVGVVPRGCRVATNGPPRFNGSNYGRVHDRRMTGVARSPCVLTKLSLSRVPHSLTSLRRIATAALWFLYVRSPTRPTQY